MTKDPDMPRQMGLFDECEPGKDTPTTTTCELLLRNLRQPEALPTELRIITDLTSRVLPSPDTPQSAQHFHISFHCITYPLSSPLITECTYYYEQQRLAIKYRMGFTDHYPDVGRKTVSDFWEAKQKTQFLYDNIITAHTPFYRPTQFIAHSERSPSEHMVSSSLKAISSYVPGNVQSYFEKWLRLKSILIKVVPSRRTKHGDYRKLPSGEHLITLNRADNHLAVTFTLLHELSHAFRPRTSSSKPHDKYWKLTFSNMLIDAIELFPKELMPYIAFVSCNPPASEDICEGFIFGTYLNKHTSTDLTFGKIDMLRSALKLEQQLGINLDRFKP